MPHKEICALVWWVQIWDLWFHPPCLCAKQKRWTDRLYMRGGGGVMVWGYFAGDTVGDLFKIEDTLNQHGYHSILQLRAIPSGLHLVGPLVIVQQDSDPKHTSRLWKVYLTKKESDGVLRQMTWPPQSPDLIPVEMVWDETDNRVKAKSSTSARHLWELHQDCRKTIAGEDLMKLIERMSRVCKGWLFWRI